MIVWAKFNVILCNFVSTQERPRPTDVVRLISHIKCATYFQGIISMEIHSARIKYICRFVWLWFVQFMRAHSIQIVMQHEIQNGRIEYESIRNKENGWKRGSIEIVISCWNKMQITSKRALFFFKKKKIKWNQVEMRIILNKMNVDAFPSCNLINERRWQNNNNEILFRSKRPLHVKPKCNLNVVFCATNLSDINKIKGIFLLAAWLVLQLCARLHTNKSKEWNGFSVFCFCFWITCRAQTDSIVPNNSWSGGIFYSLR